MLGWLSGFGGARVGERGGEGPRGVGHTLPVLPALPKGLLGVWPPAGTGEGDGGGQEDGVAPTAFGRGVFEGFYSLAEKVLDQIVDLLSVILCFAQG